MIDWKTYYYNEFPAELRQSSLTRIPQHHCEHCKAPQERRCLIDEKFLNQKTQFFRFAWYGVTLYEQGLFTYFPEAHEQWISHRGSYHLPVENIGMGCVRVVAPCRLLSINDDRQEWMKFVKFFLEETESQFESITFMHPKVFFDQLINDDDLVADPHGINFQAKFLEEALKRFKIDK
jgi:hypothetical protein